MVVINDTAGVKALEELLTAKQYTDKKVVHWWKTSAKDFADGKLVMMINFSNYASEILGAGSKVVGNIGVAMVPGKNPIYGGGTVGISKTAAEKKMHLHLSNGSQQSRRRLAWQHLGAFLHVRKRIINTIS